MKQYNLRLIRDKAFKAMQAIERGLVDEAYSHIEDVQAVSALELEYELDWRRLARRQGKTKSSPALLFRKGNK